MESSAGVEPDTGKLTLTRPEKPTVSAASISSWVSVLIKPQAAASITNVQVPLAATMLVIVNGIAAGAGL